MKYIITFLTMGLVACFFLFGLTGIMQDQRNPISEAGLYIIGYVLGILSMATTIAASELIKKWDKEDRLWKQQYKK